MIIQGKLFFYRIMATLLFSFSYSSSFSQLGNRSEDSIRNIINTTKIDTVKIENYMIMGFQLKPNLDSSIFYLNKGLHLSAKINNHYKEGAFLNLIGIKYYENGLLDSALNCFNRLLNSSLKYNYTDAIENAYLNIGNVYRAKKQYSKAIEHFHLSLKYGNNPNVYCNIGEVYYELKQNDKALEYINNGIKIANKNIETADEYSKIGNYYALSSLLSAKSKVLYLQKKYKETIPLYEESLKIAGLIQNDYNKFTTYADMGTAYYMINNSDSAQKYFNKAFELGAILNNEMLTNSLKSNSVELLLKKKN